MRCPNCLRSLAYAVATSSAPWAMPTAWAAIPGRLRSNVRMASSNPSPSSPMRFAAGTRTPSNASSAVGLPRMPHLVLEPSDAEAVGRDLDDEAREPAVAWAVRIGDREDRDEVRHGALADEPLRAGDHVVVAVADGARARGRGIGAGLGLGQGERDEVLAGRELREPACLLLRRPGEEQRQRRELLDREDQAGRGARAAELLDREADGQQVTAEAAVLDRERERQDVLRRQQLAEVLGELGRPVDLGRAWRDTISSARIRTASRRSRCASVRRYVGDPLGSGEAVTGPS